MSGRRAGRYRVYAARPMYRPKAFDITEVAEIHRFIDAAGPAHLSSMTTGGLTGSVVPLLLNADAGPFGSLVGHLARANHHWRDLTPEVESLAIFPGPDAYVSPSWYPTKAETGKVVPTWNYEVVHAAGELVVHDDVAWLDGLVRRLTARHESGRPQPWSVDDAPADFVAGQLRAIVGIELRITRLEGKRKLSQNRGAADARGAADGLAAGTSREQAVAARMRDVLAVADD